MAVLTGRAVADLWERASAGAGVGSHVTDQAVKISECESGFNTEAVNYCGRSTTVAGLRMDGLWPPREDQLPGGCREVSVGLFQINTLVHARLLGPLLKLKGLDNTLANRAELMRNPQANVGSAFDLWTAQGWGPWACKRVLAGGGSSPTAPDVRNVPDAARETAGQVAGAAGKAIGGVLNFFGLKVNVGQLLQVLLGVAVALAGAAIIWTDTVLGGLASRVGEAIRGGS